MKYHKKVISSGPAQQAKPAQVWAFGDYCFGGNNLFEAWYQGLTEEAKDACDALLKNVSKIENHLQWGLKFLQGKCKNEGIWELKFIADGKQYRILGIFDGEKKVVLLTGCYHKQHVYTPPNALDTACDRARTHRAGKASLYERKIKENL